MHELACEAKEHQRSCGEQTCDDAWLDDKPPSESDAAATRWRVLDVHALDFAPEAGGNGLRECLCLLNYGIFRRQVCVKDLDEHWEIVVIDHFSVLGVPASWKLS